MPWDASGARGAAPPRPTASCSPTGRATRPRFRRASPRCAPCSRPGRCSGSASATSCSAAPSASRRSSCGSATAAPTTRCSTSTPGRVLVTAQNHGFAVRGPETGPRVRDRPRAGDRHAHFALRRHRRGARAARPRRVLAPVPPRGQPRPARRPRGAGRRSSTGSPRRIGPQLPRRRDIRSVAVIGSGPIVIGQACEFDYSGSQALRVLRAEGIRTVLDQLEPGHDHDRRRLGRPHVPRAARRGRRRVRAPPRAARRPPADARAARRRSTWPRSSTSTASSTSSASS